MRSVPELRQLFLRRTRALAAQPRLVATLAVTYVVLVALAVVFSRSAAPGARIRLSEPPRSALATSKETVVRTEGGVVEALVHDIHEVITIAY